MQFVQFHNKQKSLFGSRSTFGALWEGNISFKIVHIRHMETNVGNDLYALSSYFFKKIWTRSSPRMWKTRLQILLTIFESPCVTIIPKIPNLCFAYQSTHLQFYPNYMHLFQCDNEYSFLI